MSIRARVPLTVLLTAALLAAVATPAWAADAPVRKKLIQLGWDMPDSERLLQNLEQIEQRPFDGVVVRVTGQAGNGRPCHLRWASVDSKWEQEWFRPAVERLKACKFTRLTDNLLSLQTNPGSVDWFDDAGWANVVDHWRIAAWVAKEGRLKGFCFDPEPYAKPYRQFAYPSQANRDRYTFDEYYAKARERGRQCMEAVTKVYPDITFLTLFMNVVNTQAADHPDPRKMLTAGTYGLYPAFIDGWLDAAPATVTFVDACERAYRFNSVEQYLEACLAIKGKCQRLVSPENRSKYRAQVQVGFGVYLDAYWNPKDSEWGRWYVDGLGGSRVDRLKTNVATALRVCDQYVWIYGEKFRWWPTPNKRVWDKTWPEGLPGCEAALRFARDPADYARTEIAKGTQSGRLTNLARNGNFSSEKTPASEFPASDWKEGAAPAGWSAWQWDYSKGTFTWDRETAHMGKGSARAASVIGGCFIQSYKVEPGKRYAVRAVRRLQGKGDATIRIRWQTPEGKWTAVSKDRFIYCHGPREGWQELVGVAQVPEAVGRLVLLLGVSGQASIQDVAWYDDVGVYELE